MDYLYRVDVPFPRSVNWPSRQAAIPGVRASTAVLISGPEDVPITRYVRPPVLIPIYPALSYQAYDVEPGLTAYLDGTALHLLSHGRARDDAVRRFLRDSM